MIINPQVSLHRLVLSLSEALDHVSPLVADHQLRVAYISVRIARLMGFQGKKLRNIFHAAALHDIGLIGSANRVQAMMNQLEKVTWHGEVGYELLKDNELLSDAAPIVRCHHAKWRNSHLSTSDDQSVPLESYIIGLADVVDRLIERDVPILYQKNKIQKYVLNGRGVNLCPDCVDAFYDVSLASAFWLDATSKRIYSILNRDIDWPTLVVDERAVESIARIFARLVDSLSPWTATHSAGVAATAVALAGKLNFSPREQILMRAAGYLHDLGKITIPSEILDKEGKPTAEERAILEGHTYYTFRILDTIEGMPQICEWAAFHHERLDGKGYPFGHRDKDLMLGSRIMAVADTFTAITEDRPYRKGMKEEKALNIMSRMTANGGLDENVFNTLRIDFDEINAVRMKAQNDYSIKQKHLTGLISSFWNVENRSIIHDYTNEI